MHEQNIKIVRLQSGEDIIADCITGENDTVNLNNPMHIIFKRMPTGRTIMMMMPWLPIELIKENVATIYTADILTLVEPKDDLVDYYNDVISSEFISEAGDIPIKNALYGKNEEEDDGDLDFSEVNEEEISKIIKEKLKGRLH